MSRGLNERACEPAAADAAGGFDRDWLAVGASAAGLIFSNGPLAVYSFGVFVRPLTAEFNWSRTGLFAALSFFQFGMALCSPLWGVLLDRFGPRRVLLFSMAALSCLVASLGLLTPHLWHIYLRRQRPPGPDRRGAPGPLRRADPSADVGAGVGGRRAGTLRHAAQVPGRDGERHHGGPVSRRPEIRAAAGPVRAVGRAAVSPSGAPAPGRARDLLRPAARPLSLLLSIAGWGWHSETAIHVLRLVLSGALDRHPKLKLIIGHMGEGLPAMFARCDQVFADEARERLTRTVSQTMTDQVWVTTSGFFSLPPLMALLMTFGADRVLFSVDYPFSPNAKGADFLRSLPIPEADRIKLAHGNADRLLGLGAG